MSTGTVLVSVVLPVRNQADHVAAITTEYCAAMLQLGLPCELILVENGSSDDTLRACQSLADQLSAVSVTRSLPGWGRAVQQGLAVARGDVLCFTNSARTRPDDLALAIRYALVNERVIVKASRKMRASLARRIGSLLFNLQARMLFGMAIWDINGTPKVFHRAHLDALALSEPGDLLDLEFAVACHRHQLPVLEVPLFAIRRHGGQSTTTWRSAMAIYAGTFRLYWRNRQRLAAAPAGAGAYADFGT